MTQAVAFKSEPEGEGGDHRIPKERVDAMIAKAKAESETRAEAAEARARAESEMRRELETRIQQTAAPSAQQPSPPTYTREQLRALVDEGKISQDQMDAELERQIEARVTERVESSRAVNDRASKINEQIDRYMERFPDLGDAGSDNRSRVVKEFQALRKLDYPNDATTELMAMRNVLGDISKERIPETSHKDRQVDTATHTSGSEEKKEEKETGPGPLKGLSKEYKDYYQKGIDDGRYKGWDDPHLIAVQKRAIARA